MNALMAVAQSPYYFWTGVSRPKSAVRDWQRNLKRLFERSGVPDAHAYWSRDTFPVQLLLAGVPIERVSILVGHQNARITEKHYAPRVNARQDQADVRRTWPEKKLPQGTTRRIHGRRRADNFPQIKLKKWWRGASRPLLLVRVSTAYSNSAL